MELKMPLKVLETQPQNSQSESTLGQRLANSMTAKIGSWAFLTVQSSVLAVWIICNSIPGVPHWDKNPFILLNLVFSFASAYTAPIVLMSQNRQSIEDRKLTEKNLEVNLKTEQTIELLHSKLDALQKQLATQEQQPDVETNVLPWPNTKFADEASQQSLPWASN